MTDRLEAIKERARAIEVDRVPPEHHRAVTRAMADALHGICEAQKAHQAEHAWLEQVERLLDHMERLMQTPKAARDE